MHLLCSHSFVLKATKYEILMIELIIEVKLSNKIFENWGKTTPSEKITKNRIFHIFLCLLHSGVLSVLQLMDERQKCALCYLLYTDGLHSMDFHLDMRKDL